MNTLFFIVLVVAFLGCKYKHSSTQSIFEKSNIDSNGLFTPKPIEIEKLSTTQETIHVSYHAISCSCAKWILNHKTGEDLSELEHVYVEPANDSLININTEWDGLTIPYQFRLTGKFYIEKGFPENYKTKGQPEPARVFRYFEVKKL